LQGFLLVCLSVFSLKNPSDKHLSLKNQSSPVSLVESLKKDPESFVEAFAQADPEKINEIILLLDNLAATALSSKQELVSKKEAADTAFEVAKKALDDAGLDYEGALVAQRDADSNLASQGPELDNEHIVTQQVIQLLRDLPCSDGYSSIKDSNGGYACYKFVSNKLDWHAAEDACVKEGAHLIRSVAANKHMMFKFFDVCFWSGANNNEGNWVWTDGTPFIKDDVGEIYDNVIRGGASNLCSRVCPPNRDQKYLEGQDCNYKKSYVCQM